MSLRQPEPESSRPDAALDSFAEVVPAYAEVATGTGSGPGRHAVIIEYLRTAGVVLGGLATVIAGATALVELLL
ncbi:hypothetical protein [Actinoplanes siamensis]|uniref:Uncharacterized protein n=1 Tax=Actinoplanes siamensis TaxID=1223317 RepID=A0A919NAQ0_9ACTN|nr:hypothetical protein [Actinoplanes siamensis]GIF07458.1 hypothetical protein Asi03nite_49960 [Actinoplanes siamensis]